ncbi:MAG: nicotinamide riboside transporter PnuC [Bacteroidales bacterium]|jgi:nicotinamide mononucleotide transporter|nr:nicotinamide riboside transporter PnuC [Bacteroidales bacterium]MCI2121753.1 nicotinamide riboside transporter PnuC [Bacteroidales bacterium]MCI2145894.1 nicotinamide riboside transporter PnuC [Bacteroidales bacterium]
MFDIDNIVFSLAGYGVSWLELVSVAAGLACVFLAAKGKVANFYVGYAYNVLLFMLFMQKHLYSSMLLQPISIAITIYGNWRWTHPKDDESTAGGALKVSTMDWLHRGFWAGMILFIGMLWGLFLRESPGFWPDAFQPDPHPYLDAFATVGMLVAQMLSAKKHLECWIVWFAVDTTQIALYLASGILFLPLVSLAYLILAIFGFTGWRKEYKNDNLTTTAKAADIKQ